MWIRRIPFALEVFWRVHYRQNDVYMYVYVCIYIYLPRASEDADFGQ